MIEKTNSAIVRMEEKVLILRATNYEKYRNHRKKTSSKALLQNEEDR